MLLVWREKPMLTVCPARWSTGSLWFWLKVCLALALFAVVFFGAKAFAGDAPPATLHSFLPYNLEARHGFATQRPLFEQMPSPALSCLHRNPSFSLVATGPDQALTRPIVQAPRQLSYPVLRREFPETAWYDSQADLRLSASACRAVKGTPDGLNRARLLAVPGLGRDGRPRSGFEGTASGLCLDRRAIETISTKSWLISTGEGGEPPSLGQPNPSYG